MLAYGDYVGLIAVRKSIFLFFFFFYCSLSDGIYDPPVLCKNCVLVPWFNIMLLLSGALCPLCVTGRFLLGVMSVRTSVKLINLNLLSTLFVRSN